ncbi:uncharacterized protein LOC116140570 isoform X2 [Pistacia vera]|uniref:uncharacterized protein LOC116140570 isoform X2 n=1 Tax=Pistacia vera TaxID=55513 RepID=UPI00126380D7|nr:uncharacterized protein LOC116140570 isoform X2 [Pistacia vera]
MLWNQIVMDTWTASQNQSSHEEIAESRASPQDEVYYSRKYEACNTLFRAALVNDWNTAYRDVYKEDPLKYSNYFSATKRRPNGNTLLHVATEANSILFVKELVNYMTKNQLTIKNRDGNTAFFVAASKGRVEIAMAMFEKNKELANIRGNGNMEMLPIHAAARWGNNEMVEFLYRIQKPLEEIDENRLFLNVMNRVSLLDNLMIKEDLEELHILTRRNDWNTAFRDIFKENPIENSKYLTARISVKEETALHVAIAKQSFTFAEELIKYMKRKDLAIKNSDGNTAFSLVVASDNVGLAKQMFEKNDELPYIHGANQMLPVLVAAQQGHKRMVEFLKFSLVVLIHGSVQEMDCNKSSAIASKNGSSEEIVENVAFHPLTNRAGDPWIMEIHRELAYAAKYNDWNIAYREIFKGDPLKNSKYLTAKISEDGNTALHLATKNNCIEFVKELIKYMLIEDLTIRNDDGDTAFLLAAGNGRMEIVNMMFEKNRWLSSIHGYSDDLPIHRAAKLGHKEMVEFLYFGTGHYLNDKDHIKLVNNLIRSGLYGLALNYLYRNPELANCREESNGETALCTLARTPKFANQKQQGNKGSDNDKVYHGRHEKLLPEALELVKWLWQQISHLDEDKISGIIDYPWPVIFTAVEEGNIDFLTIFVCKYPNLILKVDQNNYSIFHIAVLNRQKEIFKLIDHVDPMVKKLILEIKDVEENNILHLAGMMSPLEQVTNVSGVALPLQQALFWFKEVSQIVDPNHAKAKNINGKTPRDIFYEKITALKDEGEMWIKDTANPCMIVATFITTVGLSAPFTVPGVIKDETGIPNFIQKLSFRIFVISDAISLVSAFCSMLTFLSILAARYAVEDLLYVLPRKLVVGLSTLFLSIAAMMVVFFSSIFIVFEDGGIWIPILVSMIASLPVILFTNQKWRLLYDVVRSTFKIGFLSKTSELFTF